MSTNIPWTVRQGPRGPVPVYVLQFDARGTLTSPRSLAALVEDARDATDLVVLSHGWNNDWLAATSRYDDFFDHLDTVLGSHPPAADRPFRPVYVGVFWPSAALVMPWEQGPDIAAGGDGLAGELADELAVLSTDLGPELSGELHALLADPALADPGLAGDRADLAAEILAHLPVADRDETGAAGGRTDGPALRAAWEDTLARIEPEPVRPSGIIPDDAGASEERDTAAPRVAGFNPLELIRSGIRLATVRQMKDRAGRVGGTGVAAALRRLADETPARIHLVGHSYGGRVVLSAVCNGPWTVRPVDSVLLLQPALSAWAFADDVDGRPGGYRPAFDRVRNPIVTTRSAHDLPLTRVFHLALRRRADLGEAEIAGGPPSRFAALGGYGPQGVGAEALRIDRMPDVGQHYPIGEHAVDGRYEVIGVDGTWCIPGHGAVQSDQTAWALLSQMRAAAHADG
ncbi:hypothetical protein ACFWEJ_08180 [Promicromonospora sp. NPDC060204]|uniref:hypothetical protein n=1 Tax=Promicromonospora sp. NPDC060204 TaxID=3347071 RepID=UPI00365B2535